MTAPNPTQIVHMTHVKNLPSILEEGGLLSYHEMKQVGVSYRNIAYEHIQDRRESTMVFAAQGGCLHDYVPFHFSPKSPMLFTLSKGNVEGYEDGQESLIYLVSSAQSVEESGIPYVFTDGHATMAFTEFYDQLADLDQVDWDVMQSRFWFDTDEDPDRKRRRQAEFLVHKKLPVELVRGIAVFSAGMERRVGEILSEFGVNIAVKEKRNWYY